MKSIKLTKKKKAVVLLNFSSHSEMPNRVDELDSLISCVVLWFFKLNLSEEKNENY
jgi:hypothetical protein